MSVIASQREVNNEAVFGHHEDMRICEGGSHQRTTHINWDLLQLSRSLKQADTSRTNLNHISAIRQATGENGWRLSAKATMVKFIDLLTRLKNLVKGRE